MVRSATTSHSAGTAAAPATGGGGAATVTGPPTASDTTAGSSGGCGSDAATATTASAPAKRHHAHHHNELVVRRPPQPPSAAAGGGGGGGCGGNAAKVRVVHTLTKSHQIEGDGLLPLLYYHLYRKTWNAKKEYQSCPGARCPDTVVYEHSFPQHWYTYNAKHAEIQKRPGWYLDTAQIYRHFSRPVTRGLDVVAQYICTQEGSGAEDEAETSVEFFTADTLLEFLRRRSRPDGVLQRFVAPKGERNFQIQAVWSPKVTLVYKRTNTRRMCDQTVRPYERSVTCDGPSHYCRDDLVAARTRQEVVALCNNFVQHFAATEHRPVSRLVLHLKADARGNLWILWASSLRIGSSRFASAARRVPLNLSAPLVRPATEAHVQTRHVEGPDLDRALLVVDTVQYSLSSEANFAAARGDSGSPAHHHSAPPPPPAPPSPLLSTRRFPAPPAVPRGGGGGGGGRASQSARPPRTRLYLAPSDRPPFLPSPRLHTAPPPLCSPRNPFHERAVVLGLEAPVPVRPRTAAAASPAAGGGAGGGGGGATAATGGGGGGGYHHHHGDAAGVGSVGSAAAGGVSSGAGRSSTSLQLPGEQGASGAAAAAAEASAAGAARRRAERREALEKAAAEVAEWACDQLYALYSHWLNPAAAGRGGGGGGGRRQPFYTQPTAAVWAALGGSSDGVASAYMQELSVALGLRECDGDFVPPEGCAVEHTVASSIPYYYYCGDEGGGCGVDGAGGGGGMLGGDSEGAGGGGSGDRPTAQRRIDIDATVEAIVVRLREEGAKRDEAEAAAECYG